MEISRQISNGFDKQTDNQDISVLTYFVLSGPAFLATLILAILYFVNIDLMVNAVNGIIPFATYIYQTTTILGLVLPGIVIIISLYALFTFRPGLIITVLTLFYLIVVSVSNFVDPYFAAFTVFSVFSTLISFSYSRQSKLRMGRKTFISTSSGPTRFILATYGFDIVLPLVTILGAMFLIAYVMNIIQSQAHILPEPLGTLGGLYLQSRLYLMLTTLTVAGVIIWMIREFFEPILLRFTLTIHDAREYLLDQLSSDLRRIYWHQTWRPRINVRRVVFLDTVLVVFVIIILLAFGSGQGDELLKIFGLASPQVNMTGYYVDLNAKLIVRFWDRIIIAFQDLLAKIIKILWG